MKKIIQIFAAITVVVSVGVASSAAHAQVQSVNPFEDTPGPTATSTPDPTAGAPLPSTGAAEVGTPKSGIAPSSKAVQNALIFTGGSALGGLLGFAVLQLKKRQQ